MMRLIVVTGGVRSGKSRWAQGEALALGGEDVTVIATAEREAVALEAMAAEIDGILEAREARAGVLIVVTNEVGWSVHPPTAVGRWYQDGLGIANQRLAAVADKVVLMVSGLETRLK